jgi:hypothetical protein
MQSICKLQNLTALVILLLNTYIDIYEMYVYTYVIYMIWNEINILKKHLHSHILAKKWIQLHCPLTNEWIKKMLHIYNGTLFGHEKGWYHVICSHMVGNGDHYVKWSKPGIERQVLHSCVQSKTVDLIEGGSTLWEAGENKRREGGEMLVSWVLG